MQKSKWERRYFLKRFGRATLILTGVLLTVFWFSLPNPLFKDPVSKVLEDRDGNLLGARIAKDGQWRFPFNEEVPDNFEKAIIAFEDKRFYKHPGFDPIAFGRALSQNIRNGRVVSGGSTLSMQVIRMARKGKPRTLLEKFIEVWLALRLELRFSKKEILALYASNAPFGGNVVGLDAASWRYFGKKPQLLSWSEATTLAVLPNSPALIYPGRNRRALTTKRDQLLEKLLGQGAIDSVAYLLALEEPLPDRPKPLPNLAPHLLDRAFSEKQLEPDLRGTKVVSTLDGPLQSRINELCVRKGAVLNGNEIHNLAVLVLDVEKNEVLAYVGNEPGAGAEHGEDVDIIKAPRSTGSILKPMLYAMMMQEGQLLPTNLLPDVPTQMNGYRPENFLETYNGVVPAKTALVRSLNVPFVRMLQQYGVEKFHHNLKKLGLTTLTFPPQHYGLTLILGGAEGSLWDIANVYGGMARTLNHFYPNNGRYSQDDFKKASYQKRKDQEIKAKSDLLNDPSYLSANAIWFAFDAMHDLQRPNAEGTWEKFESTIPIAWKTGTSFGFRDAWAIGVTPKYVVGIWAGNADGEGRPGLVGIYAAAPLLFEVFDLLSSSRWFDAPFDEMKKMTVCRQSGFLALPICEKDTVWGPLNGLNSQPCPYHQLINLDKGKQFQVSADCELPSNMVQTPWFLLPPLEEFYYRSQNPNYRPLPPFRKDCGQHMKGDKKMMELIYPKNPTKIYVPVDLDGKMSRTVFKIAHRRAETLVYWHIDNQYIGMTSTFHEMALNPSAGKHILTVVDEMGNRLEQVFEILPRGK
ncbi:MAG: penicillin-binding protein 1C [Saprospiraceae bacterium]